MLTDEQRAFVAARRDHDVEFKVFSGDVYVKPLGRSLSCTACDPDGNEREDIWPQRGVSLADAAVSEQVVRSNLGMRPIVWSINPDTGEYEPLPLKYTE